MKLPDRAQSASDSDAGQRSPAHRRRQPEAPDHARGEQRAGEITGRIDGVHEAGRGIRPAERVAHVRQHQRIGEAADAEADGRRQRQDQDQPRGMRGRHGSVAGQGILRQERICGRPRPAIAQGGGAVNGALPIALRRFSTPPRILSFRGVVMPRADAIAHRESRRMPSRKTSGSAGATSGHDEPMRNLPWRPINCCFSPATASALK